MATNDGGSVFPRSNHAACIPSEGCRIQPGLTLRDYFAASALPALIPERVLPWEEVSAGKIATMAYGLADAMLKAREGGR